jgi:hypothetical protein
MLRSCKLLILFIYITNRRILIWLRTTISPVFRENLGFRSLFRPLSAHSIGPAHRQTNGANKMKKATKLVITAILVLTAGTGAIADGGHRSTTDVYWWWGEGPVGTSQVVRTPGGLSVRLQAGHLPAGHAMTLWVMFFDNPAACSTSPCTLADIGNPDVGFDFHYAGGNIANGNKTTISGHIRVGELGTSGWAEVGATGAAVALSNPMGAEVALAVHSHGPAQQGMVLAEQMSSYLGGCDVFLGPGGFAASMGDVPGNPGECSTIQGSAPHVP